jgi:hypothetical protein
VFTPFLPSRLTLTYEFPGGCLLTCPFCICSAGGSLGALSHAIVVDQFTRMRDGDSWWYENPGVLDVPTLNQIKATTWVRAGRHAVSCIVWRFALRVNRACGLQGWGKGACQGVCFCMRWYVGGWGEGRGRGVLLTSTPSPLAVHSAVYVVLRMV